MLSTPRIASGSEWTTAVRESGRLRRMSRTATGESVLSRAVRIVEAFTPEDTTLRVSEIAGPACTWPPRPGWSPSWSSTGG